MFTIATILTIIVTVMFILIVIANKIIFNHIINIFKNAYAKGKLSEYSNPKDEK